MIWVFQSFFGQLVDATVGQMVHALGTGAPQPVWSPQRIELPREIGPIQEIQPLQEVEPPPPQGLTGGDVKLVRYSIVSLRPCHERLLRSSQKIVKGSMTDEAFATWRIAAYLEKCRQPVPREDLRHLRVSYQILERWPRRPKDCCDDSETQALREILATLRSFPAPGTVKPPRPGLPVSTLVWDGGGTPSQVGARGRVTLTKKWNGSRYDVTLEGRLSIHSPSYGYVRHGLPPGYLPVSTDPRAYPCEIQQHAFWGDLSGLDNYGGRGVHVRNDDTPGYAGRATLWFPERSYNGEIALRCAWDTDEDLMP